ASRISTYDAALYLAPFPTRRSSDLDPRLITCAAAGRTNRPAVVLSRPARSTPTVQTVLLPSAPWTRTAPRAAPTGDRQARLRKRSEEHTSELQSRFDLVCRPLLEKQ